ncbi:2,3-diaminopropionate biosynthesis protein SbnB [Paenibacillus silviterrae]|uniref:2,3-diaminopropionate biosynthesis protein SbnB n=1 Tax=Paenibacillus silviterrae TaxID=3242194 RepID=UPI00254396A4|nr:2,3-diaminopropionate biosynthesis protein SbnB [Paenibacillus chinjuensis]
MLYLNDKDIQALGMDWPALLEVIESTVRLLDAGDYAQPMKPYLRYGDPNNRIIAMPAYVGGEVHTAGIKWIASFPGNHAYGLPRAHSVVVLNESRTGQPSALLCSPLPSIVRTASVSGLLLRRVMEARSYEQLQLGIIGWGPIGRCHARMALSLYGDRIGRIRVYDKKGVGLEEFPPGWQERIQPVKAWEEAYLHSEVCITCTVSDDRYITLPPRPGSLLLHVSLRDYAPEALAPVEAIIVDDWDEVCRENTDIELLHKMQGLTRADTLTLADVICRDALAGIDEDQPILFCPMGMAVFDIAVASYYVKAAKERGAGIVLD